MRQPAAVQAEGGALHPPRHRTQVQQVRLRQLEPGPGFLA